MLFSELSMQHISFYDLIVTKARGKSGPLFHFDVHDDVRLVGDVRVEKDESHPGMLSRRYTLRSCSHNKHLCGRYFAIYLIIYFYGCT